MNTLKRVVAVAALGLSFGLGSCSNDTKNEPQVEPKDITTEFSSTITLEELSVQELGEDGLKALDFKLAPNGNYRKPIVQFTEGQTVPVLCVIRNEAGVGTGRPVIVRQVNMTYKGGQLVAERLPLNIPSTTNLAANPNGWRMICIVGHQGYTASSASFTSGSVLQGNAAPNNIRPINAIYMNKDKGGAASWTKLNVVNLPDGSKGFQAAEVTRLVSQGTVFVFNAKNTTSRTKVLTGVSIESNSLSFAGSIQGLSNVEVSEGLPKFVGTTSTVAARLATRMPVQANATIGAYVLYGIPDADATTNTITVRARTGDNFVKARGHKFSFNPEANKFYGLGVIKLSKLLTHPIEAMLFNENTSQVFVGNQGTFTQIKDTTYDTEYRLPSAARARALFPGFAKAGGPRGNDDYGIVNFYANVDRAYTNHFETIETFEEGANSFTGDYRNYAGSNISYAIRFKDGLANKYYSAYRYEMVGTRENGTAVKITVRHLGPTRTSTTITDISNEAYWNSPAPEGVKVIERTLDRGKYFTSTTQPSGLGEVAQLIRVFEWDNALLLNDAKNSVYIADLQGGMDRTNAAANQSKYLLFTQYTD